MTVMMNITLFGNKLKGNLPVNLEDGYEACLTKVSTPKYWYKFDKPLKIEVRLDKEKQQLALHPGFFPTVTDLLLKLNTLVADEAKSISFLFSKATMVVGVQCQERATILLPLEICNILKLPHISLRGNTFGSGPVDYINPVLLFTSDIVQQQSYNQRFMPLLGVLPIDEKFELGNYVKLRKVAGVHEFEVDVIDAVTGKPPNFFGGVFLLELHIRKCA